MGQRRGPALRLDRSPQRAGQRAGDQTPTRSPKRHYFGPLTSARKVPETQPYTPPPPPNSSGHASSLPQTPTPNSDPKDLNEE
ncbi:hypothetical protein E5288_WYG000589 [Bos mutus]|uniref:Uncharacterized protein n=1 Tax=Bos mutus TaxID=72004 RepID=A0A6B0QPB3_9CETA|nr:hypothetical protein [Bos mutus]